MSALKKNFVSAGVPSGKVRARHIGQGAYSVFRIIILLAIGFVILYPLLYMVSTSLRSRASFMNSVRVWLPEKLDALTNYRVAIKALHYKDGLISSLKYEIVSAVLEIISCAVAAYGFARFKFPFKKMFTAMLFLTILIPDTMIIIPRVVNNSQLDFLGILALFNRLTGIDLRPNVLNTGLTFWLPSLLAAGLRSGILIFIYIQFFKGLPAELEPKSTKKRHPTSNLSPARAVSSTPGSAGVQQASVWTWPTSCPTNLLKKCAPPSSGSARISSFWAKC